MGERAKLMSNFLSPRVQLALIIIERHLILANQKPVISATQKNSKVFQNGALKKRIFVLKISAFSAMIK